MMQVEAYENAESAESADFDDDFMGAKTAQGRPDSRPSSSPMKGCTYKSPERPLSSVFLYSSASLLLNLSFFD